jgi:hypothetical protein
MIEPWSCMDAKDQDCAPDSLGAARVVVVVAVEIVPESRQPVSSPCLRVSVFEAFSVPPVPSVAVISVPSAQRTPQTRSDYH